MRFENLDLQPHHRGFGSVMRWKLGLHPRQERPPPPQSLKEARQAPIPVLPNDGTALREAVRPALTWIGHATFLVQLGGRSILTDPVLSSRIAVVPRLTPPGLSYEALPRIDAVTVSHNHRDHMDAPTLRRLGPEVTYVTGKGQGAWFRGAGLPRVIELSWWESCQVGGVTFTFVPAQHWSRRGLFDEDRTLWGGFVLHGAGRSVYHSGDTATFSGFKEIGARLGPLDAAMLPIGAYEPRWFMKAQHMDPREAVAAFIDLSARRFVAMHWGTFKLTDEPILDPPRVLREAWQERGLPDDRLCVPAIGETIWL